MRSRSSGGRRPAPTARADDRRDHRHGALCHAHPTGAVSGVDLRCRRRGRGGPRAFDQQSKGVGPCVHGGLVKRREVAPANRCRRASRRRGVIARCHGPRSANWPRIQPKSCPLGGRARSHGCRQRSASTSTPRSKHQLRRAASRSRAVVDQAFEVRRVQQLEKRAIALRARVIRAASSRSAPRSSSSRELEVVALDRIGQRGHRPSPVHATVWLLGSAHASAAGAPSHARLGKTGRACAAAPQRRSPPIDAFAPAGRARARERRRIGEQGRSLDARQATRRRLRQIRHGSLALRGRSSISLRGRCRRSLTARRTGAIVGSGSVARTSTIIALQKLGFSTSGLCEVPGTTAGSLPRTARWVATTAPA
jgi:hypothetical protein